MLELQFENISPSSLTEEIFQGIAANVVWTPADHQASEISQFHVERVDPPFIFSIFRSFDIYNFLIVSLNSTQISIRPETSETNFLFDKLLTERQRRLIVM